MEQDVGYKSKRKWVKVIGLSALALIAIAFGKSIGMFVGKTVTNEFSTGYQESSKDRALEEGLLQAVALLRKQTPIHVDEITILRDAMATHANIPVTETPKAQMLRSISITSGTLRIASGAIRW
jgi:hypothetical protein